MKLYKIFDKTNMLFYSNNSPYWVDENSARIFTRLNNASCSLSQNQEIQRRKTFADIAIIEFEFTPASIRIISK